MLEDLKKEVLKLAQDFRISCEDGNDRLCVQVRHGDWLRFIELMYHESVLSFTRLRCLTAMNSEKGLQIVAEITSPYWNEGLSVRTKLETNQVLPSLRKIWPYSDWLEWEMQELFGFQVDEKKPEQGFLIKNSRQEFPLRVWS